jgi:hypothetical protein
LLIFSLILADFFSYAPAFFCSILFGLNARCSAAARSGHARGGRSSSKRRRQQRRRRRSRVETNGKLRRLQAAFATTGRTEKGLEKLTWQATVCLVMNRRGQRQTQHGRWISAGQAVSRPYRHLA